MLGEDGLKIKIRKICDTSATSPPMVFVITLGGDGAEVARIIETDLLVCLYDLASWGGLWDET